MTSARPPSIETILDDRDGIAAIVEIINGFEAADWRNLSPCDGWSAQDIATHLVTVTTMWHQALDDSEAGITKARWSYASMPADNAKMMEALPDQPAPDRIKAFVSGANTWLDRVEQADPTARIPVAAQDVAAVQFTVALFAWMAGVEGHVHAWDLAKSAGRDYRTPHAGTIWEAMMAVRGVDDAGTDDPWQALLGIFRPQAL